MTNEFGLTLCEYNVLVRMDPREEKTAGGIILPAAAKDKDELATDEGTLVAVSPFAFSYADGWPEGTQPQVGDRVMFAQYAGRIIEKHGVKGRVLKDKDVIGVVQQPRAVAQAA